jgi:hypothetical protein
MPYIKEEIREKFYNEITHLSDKLIDNSEDKDRLCGNLNYCFSVIMDKILENEKNYSMINCLIGSLECCKLELYRRIASPYEDVKIVENGDVYLKGECNA